MDNTDNLFHPSLEAAVMKLDPEDGEQIIDYFKTHALLTREKALLQASVREQKKLLVENAKLKKDIEQLKTQLQDKQRRRAAKSLLPTAPQTPNLTSTTAANQPSSPAGATGAFQVNPLPSSSSSHERRDKHSRRRRGERKARSTSDLLSLGMESQVDVSRLDLRVGRILSARVHPLAEAMIVQEVDMGENSSRTVVSKVGQEAKPEELQGSLAVLLCNVKACKLKGVVSQARLLCCCISDDCVELLVPPTGSTPGDRVTFLNYPGMLQQGHMEKLQGTGRRGRVGDPRYTAFLQQASFAHTFM
ncbi:aminoacyl tRNA synthase complex-interacting multifunctional protein 1 isoform X2 [Simochromis diagramma]|uniref:aminoacyl tRNA synthase complex-interacting multifunctional protein 1 isoform X2 n=1 Tax=Simochromis diagramma TaxID=43689 RepID=UPI001A7E975B|nr:aminoacyl tRNA synthase complex-interacting multifunctional protein 1 isoform X2 [Simochromis diagramma]